MARKTEGVCLLVRDVLQKLPKPYGEDVIEDVFVEIEGDREWHGRYDELVDGLTRPVVNSFVGWHTRDLTGFDTLRVVEARRSSLIKYYSKLIPK
jgi:hypothetical protein